MRQGLKLDSQATYLILVQGYLDVHWSDWFDGMKLSPDVGEDGLSVTKVTGFVIDQAALHGIFRKLYDLGMPLLLVECITFGKDDKE